MMNIWHEKLVRLDLASLFASRLFWFGLLLKFVLGAIFTSDYLRDLFVPFIDYYSQHLLADPYRVFAEAGAGESFPYPALMLYLMSLPRLIFSWGGELSLATLWIYRLPLLLFDLLGLLVLWRWVRGRRNRRNVLLFYWLSPVLIYISYIHGQLDVIPIGITLTALYLLFKDKYFSAAVLLGLAISTKIHIVLVLPFLFGYLVNCRLPRTTLLALVASCVGTVLLVNVRFLWSPEFYQLVFANTEQAKVFDFRIPFFNRSGVEFYLIPAAYCLLFAISVFRKSYNKDILIMYLGFSFGILLFFIPPQPGWYYWVLPFFAYFYCKEDVYALPMFVGLQICYLTYFALSQQSDFLQVGQLVMGESEQSLYAVLQMAGINADRLENVAFTLLQTALLLNCLWIYHQGLSSYKKHRITTKPYMIGDWR